jgi:hypothetical protein
MFVGSSSGATRNLFDAHQVFSQMSGAHQVCTHEEGADILNDMVGGSHTNTGSAKAGAGEVEVKEIIEVIDADIGKSIGKRKPR